MEQSILNSIKKALGLDPEYKAFDHDVIMYINAVFVTLNQLGIGPEDGFMIEDELPVWADFMGDDMRYNNVKTYVSLRVRLLFDPPTVGYLIDSLDKQIEQLEWRLNIYREETAWVDPNPPLLLPIDE